ncbi:hypothetical protein PPERSA_00213 [Pseudocohnilembus persalinus]|uniref:Transmembrane protein n=1 Tax=Pseudocohnilembus persalinus TaxID=266149 RepID=A0A0V0QQG6_PSEPJ|nr:hypothetical protein PPERSA_00213 [Pseudocohnilembus persalinus]|eukprot:KRX04444.1 hypothetical protein PPERSA_00213 [Pseudocohnilembus persalinus]
MINIQNLQIIINQFQNKIQQINLQINKIKNYIIKTESDEHPLAQFFKMLKIQLNHVEEEQKMHEYVKECLTNCNGETHNFKIELQDLYKVEREGEEQRYIILFYYIIIVIQYIIICFLPLL